MINNWFFLYGFLSLCCFLFVLIGQNLVDGIAAIVGEHVILKSDVAQLVQMTAMEQRLDPQTNVKELEELQSRVVESLINQKKRGIEKKLVGLDVQGDKPAIGSILYSKSKKEIGIVTAAMWSPSLKSNIAIGYVDKENMKLGTIILAEIYHPEELEYRKIWAKCKVVKKQFINLERKNAVPAFI